MKSRVTNSKHGDLSGRRFGRWEVLRKGPERFIRKDGTPSEFMYWCRCDCGVEKYVKPQSLYNGDSKSCGCLRSELKAGRHLYGKRFGDITVIERSDTYRAAGRKHFLYRCLCHVCGNEFLSDIGKIHRGISCGCVPQGARLPRGESGFNRLWDEYVRGAKNRKIDWQLSRDEFRSLVTQPCHYCGKPPSSTKSNNTRPTKWSQFLYNGIDRIENEVGYIVENTVPCCSECNFAKATMSYQSFIEMAIRIALIHGQLAIQP